MPEKFGREFLLNVARTSLKTKITEEMPNQVTEIVTDAVLTIKRENNIDLYTVEIMHMQNKLATETIFVKGLVIDHDGRHPEMPKKLQNCYILNCNVSLEYEKTKFHSQFIYSNPE